jgi:beta-N-acetylhexosaminidase
MAVGAFICGCRGPVLNPDEEAFIRDAEPWGLILFKRNIDTPDQVRALTRRFREVAGRAEAPVLVDQEGGRVQRLGPPHWRQYPAARCFGELYGSDPLQALAAARLIARLMAEELHELGIDVDCLPVLDVPVPGSHDVIGDRAYAGDGRTAALLGRAAMTGLMSGGVLGVIKHIPGHGRAASDSHLALPIVETAREVLAGSDFIPFAALADAPMAMTAHVVYSAIDSRNPATMSRAVIEKIIRSNIGFDGLLMSDDLSMGALSGGLAERAQRAIAAGCDIALHCNGDLREMREVATGAGKLGGAALERAQAALAARRTPASFDRNKALDELELLLEPTRVGV